MRYAKIVGLITTVLAILMICVQMLPVNAIQASGISQQGQGTVLGTVTSGGIVETGRNRPV